MNEVKAKMIEVYTKNLEGIWFGVACKNDEILVTWFAESQEKTNKGLLSEIPFNEPFQFVEKPSALAANTVSSFKKVYDGEGVSASFPFAYSLLPAYTQIVLKATFQVPVGYVTTYGALAEAVGGGARAVGNVMASNRFAPIVPCHRVVKSDFTLGGYGGGLRLKVALLNREKRGFSSPSHVRVVDGNLTVFPVEFVLKKLPEPLPF
jgi:methylated-DNA-[protein]-cysteine S-methyltransferase